MNNQKQPKSHDGDPRLPIVAKKLESVETLPVEVSAPMLHAAVERLIDAVASDQPIMIDPSQAMMLLYVIDHAINDQPRRIVVHLHTSGEDEKGE